MPERKEKIQTADPEIAMTYELMQAMKRVFPGATNAKRRAVLHMALAHMSSDVFAKDGSIWLKLD